MNLLQDCLSDGSSAVKVQGILTNFSFSEAKLVAHRQEITDLLNQLPRTFRESEDGGWSFLQACFDSRGHHWGEHPHMEALMCLGLAIGKVEYLMPRELWKVLPGGMPYFVIKDYDENSKQSS